MPELSEFKPLVDEYHRLSESAAALERIEGSALAAIAPGRPDPRRPRGSGRKAAGSRAKASRRKLGRPAVKPGGAASKRAPADAKEVAGAARAFSFIMAQPETTILDRASRWASSRSSLYPVLPGLEKDGKVRKTGRGWQPEVLSTALARLAREAYGTVWRPLTPTLLALPARPAG